MQRFGSSRLPALFLIGFFVPVPLISAQVEPPPVVTIVDGAATLERDATNEPAFAGMPLADGDRLATASGRVEVAFPDGSILDLDDFSLLTIVSPMGLQLTQGRLIFTVRRSADPSAPAVQYQLDTPTSSIVTDGAGQYRLSYPQAINAARFDDFDRWVQLQRGERQKPTASAQYLPADVRPYSTSLESEGSWQYEPPYGYVWYPVVAVGWRPFYNGYWTRLPSQGWTWVGKERWSWATHHYGRWGTAHDRWYWIPGSGWGPGWVSWASAPGYVSWCPVGVDNRPVFPLYGSSGSYWNGWTVLPTDRFGIRSANVSQFALNDHRPAASTFIRQATAPVSLTAQIRPPANAVASGDPNRPAVYRVGPSGVRGSATGDRGVAGNRTANQAPVYRGSPRGPNANGSPSQGSSPAAGIRPPVGIPSPVGIPGPVGIPASPGGFSAGSVDVHRGEPIPPGNRTSYQRGTEIHNAVPGGNRPGVVTNGAGRQPNAPPQNAAGGQAIVGAARPAGQPVAGTARPGGQPVIGATRPASPSSGTQPAQPAQPARATAPPAQQSQPQSSGSAGRSPGSGSVGRAAPR